MECITQDILFIILLYTDNLTNISVNKNINNMSKNIFTYKLFWINKLNYYNIYDMLTINGKWVYNYYCKHNIALPICNQQVSKLRQGGYAIINGYPCKIIAMSTNRD